MPRPTAKPTKTERWPVNHGRITLNLNYSDRIILRTVTDKVFPGSVEISNAGEVCTVILGHKKAQDNKIDLLAEDTIYTCIADSKGRLSSVGLQNVEQNCTIILHFKHNVEAYKIIEKKDKKC